ncbi:MAG: rhodanese-like domain-containing protein [Bacteroidetes bacterium]|nr:rhodanese-like domain-containing protein [Bacteroidota bacterium]
MDTFSDSPTLSELQAHCFVLSGLRFISAREAWPLLMRGLLMVDLRPVFARAGKQPDIPNLLSLPYTELPHKIAFLPRDKPLILADAVGLRSKEWLIRLSGMGFGNMVSLAGGFVDWERNGFPMKTDRADQLHGGCMCQLRKRI